jgi:hypothetical protein
MYGFLRLQYYREFKNKPQALLQYEGKIGKLGG